MIQISPKKDQVKVWVESYVPDKDFFFLREQDMNLFEDVLTEILLVPSGEFFNNNTYNQIQLVNSYEYWNISKEAIYVIVAPPLWVTQLPIQKQKDLFNIQVEVHRGLILPLTLFSNSDVFPNEYIVGNNLVLQSQMWKRIPYEEKASALMKYAPEWDGWSGIEVPEEASPLIKKFANSFSTTSGSNCLAATLSAVTNQEWMIFEWVHQETFKHGLKHAEYDLVNEDICAGDVVTWVNSDGIIQHASYSIGNHLFFNKNGQTFFNPWKIVSWEELEKTWKDYTIQVYRKAK
jgi:hypothetical protein